MICSDYIVMLKKTRLYHCMIDTSACLIDLKL